MSGMLYFAPRSLCQLEPMDEEGFTKIQGTNLGTRLLGVLRLRALILHLTLWTKLRITERTPNCFHFPVHPTSAYFAERMGTRGIRAAQKAIACGWGEEGVVTAAALPCNSSLISLPSLPSPPSPAPFLSVNLSPRFSSALPALRDL